MIRQKMIMPTQARLVPNQSPAVWTDPVCRTRRLDFYLDDFKLILM
jgi:hypothetical protein